MIETLWYFFRHPIWWWRWHKSSRLYAMLERHEISHIQIHGFEYKSYETGEVHYSYDLQFKFKGSNDFWGMTEFVEGSKIKKDLRKWFGQW